jgi:AraC-like DNA-binding protein
MDALSTILESVGLRSVVYSKFPLATPWGLDIVKDENSQFWRLVSGSCTIGSPDGRIIEMAEGDLVFVPHGSAHWIADSATSLRIPSPEFVKARREGIPVFNNGDNRTILVAGHNEKPGSSVMLKNLSEIMFINIIRAYLEQAVPETGFLSALNDPRISKALKLMQDSPKNDWTLESLASEIGMSRSVFFNQFKKLVHETPLSYLTNWRIRQAQKLLIANNSNISEIAANVGYQSESAFNRIFKSKTGQTPAVYRRSKFSK